MEKHRRSSAQGSGHVGQDQESFTYSGGDEQEKKIKVGKEFSRSFSKDDR